MPKTYICGLKLIIMKRLAFLAVCFLALGACNNSGSDTSEPASDTLAIEQPAVGGDRDEHGCLTAAGETWSVLKQSCVQIFNVGQRLNPVDQSATEATLSAFVIVSDDKTQAEVFLPGEEGSIVLEKSGDESYQKDAIQYDAAKSVLSIDNTEKYKAE